MARWTLTGMFSPQGRPVCLVTVPEHGRWPGGPPCERQSASPRYLSMGDGQSGGSLSMGDCQVDPRRHVLHFWEGQSASSLYDTMGEGQSPLYSVANQEDLPRNETPWHNQSKPLEPTKRKGNRSPASLPHKLGKAGPKRRRGAL